MPGGRQRLGFGGQGPVHFLTEDEHPSLHSWTPSTSGLPTVFWAGTPPYTQEAHSSKFQALPRPLSVFELRDLRVWSPLSL